MTDAADSPSYEMETTWVIDATYAPDAAEARVPLRPRHLARMARLMAEGTVVVAGAYADMSSSMIIVRAADEAAALEIAREDLYMQNGIWVELRARPFNQVRLEEG
jgi:uncharacterized protein YciI